MQKLFVQLLIRRRLFPACGSPAKESTYSLTKTHGHHISLKTNLVITATEEEMSRSLTCLGRWMFGYKWIRPKAA
jgi:hypothetical protein